MKFGIDRLLAIALTLRGGNVAMVLCDGETDPREMVDAICGLSGLPNEVVSEDVDRILGEFDRAGILTWTE